MSDVLTWGAVAILALAALAAVGYLLFTYSMMLASPGGWLRARLAGRDDHYGEAHTDWLGWVWDGLVGLALLAVLVPAIKGFGEFRQRDRLDGRRPEWTDVWLRCRALRLP